MKVLPSGNRVNGQTQFEENERISLGATHEIVSEHTFTRLLCLERRRAERSHKHFLLMLLDVSELLLEHLVRDDRVLNSVLSAVLGSTRETDISGWYEDRVTLGTILTEVPPNNLSGAVSKIFARVDAALLQSLSLSQVNKLRFSFHLFPEAPHNEDPLPIPADLKLYPDLLKRDTWKRSSRVVKRSIDFTASITLLALFSPLMALIAVSIKLTSKGPVLFRQERLGHYGRPFAFLKFRSMHANSDSTLHRDYVTRFITGAAVQHPGNGSKSDIYKLTSDPRITRLGRFLRKTSLDELPQLFNVFMGQMSLVGPRPPISYEIASYEAWHRRRLFEAKPGITGLWQVCGRSRTKFDEMVRLDLKYAKSWSLALDFKILLQTPRAVLSGEGAY